MKASVYVPVMIVVFSAILALAGDANAQQVCVGQPTRFTLEVDNTGTQDDTYIITPSDTSWVNVQDSVFIKKDTTVVLDVVVTAPKVGPNPFFLTVTSTHGYEEPKKVGGNVIAVECRDVSVVISPSKLDACQSNAAVFKIFVKNGGQVADSFDLSTTMGSLQKTKVELDPGKSEEVNMIIDTRSLEGEYEILVSAFSGQVSDSSKANISVANCYSAELEIKPSENAVCACCSADFQIQLKNTGKLEDNYVVNVEDELVQTVKLKPGESGVFNYTIPVRCGSGTREIKATAESDNIALEDRASLVIKPTSECYSLDVSVSQSRADVVKCTAKTLSMTIKNTGEKTQLFTLGLDAPEWVHLSRDSAYLEPGEEKEVYLYISPELETDTGAYEIKVNVSAEYFQQLTEISVNVLPEEGAAPPTQGNGTTGTGNGTDTNTSTGTGNDNITGGIIAVGMAPLWKAIVIGIITVIIIGILVVRFAILVKR